MAQTDLGKWMITNGGNYNSETTYEQLTIVLYNNSMFLTLKTVKGITPVNDNINYSLMAQAAATTLLSGINATDTYGVLGEVGATVSSQALVDYLADSVINKLIAKTQIANNLTTQDSNKVLSALQGYNLKQSVDELNGNLEWKYVADVIGSSTINIPSDACEIFVTATKSSAIYDGVTTLSLLVPVRILSTVYQDFLNGGYGNNDQQTYLAFFRINKYNAHLYALKVAGQDYTATSQLKMWYR